MLIRLLPLMGLIVFIGIAFVWRGWIQYRRFGHWGVVLFRFAGWRRQVRDAFFCLLFLAITLQALLFAVAPEMLAAVQIVEPTLLTAGLGSALLLAGLLFTVAAQLGMGASWRVGIDHSAKPGLVTAGLYQFCRNPIYLGMFMTLAGLTVLLPTWSSVALLLAVVWCVHTQVIEEEAYLRRTYGHEFEAYASRIGRFVPGLGKLPG